MPIHRALQKAAAANILVVSAAGNDGKNIDNKENYVFPACTSFKNQIVVGASKCAEKIWEQSNYGRKKVDIFAPGENVAVIDLYGSTWFYGNGTSYATAIVTGMAAVLRTQQTARNYATLKCALKGGVVSSPTFSGYCNSGGVINAPLVREKFATCPR